MSIHVALNHVTHYRYDRPINLGPQIVRLRPAPHSRTRILSYSMRVEPATHLVEPSDIIDAFGAARRIGADLHRTRTQLIGVEHVEIGDLRPAQQWIAERSDLQHRTAVGDQRDQILAQREPRRHPPLGAPDRD